MNNSPSSNFLRTILPENLYSKLNLSPNARIMMKTEPCWSVSIVWFGVYLPIYMRNIGLSETQIGWVTFYTVIGQILGVLLGGFLADHWGRKKTLITFDMLAWAVPLFFWYIATGFWDFAIAGFFFGFGMIVVPAWLCLFTEESTPDQTRNAFLVFWFILSLSGLVSPAIGLVINHYGLIQVCRWIILLSVVSISFGIFTRFRLLKETNQSPISSSTTPSEKSDGQFLLHWDALKWAWKQPFVNILLISGIMHGLFTVMWASFAPIYWTDKNGLQLSDSIVSLVPAAYAVSMCLVIIFLIPVLQKISGIKVLIFSISIILFGMILFLLTPQGMISILLLYAIFFSGGLVIYSTIRDSNWLLSLTHSSYRAKILAIITLIGLITTIPIGPLGGYLYLIHPKLPFLFSLGLEFINLLLLIRFILKYPDLSNQVQSNQ